MTKSIFRTEFPKLKLIKRGKVRDLYAVKDALLLVATDRISAFDVIMSDPIPGKGIILNQMSVFWFKQMKDIIDNHIISAEAADFPKECAPYLENLKGRSMLVKNANRCPWNALYGDISPVPAGTNTAAVSLFPGSNYRKD